MARISTYAIDTVVNGTDKLVGTDAEDNNITKNYKVDDIVTYVSNNLAFLDLDSFADDAAAGSDGYEAGDLYQTTGTGAAPLNVAGIVMIKQ
ncbi:MAG: hypothetical protein P1U35_14105 [Cycloclasticus sp.]|nr:hypothetical protein [Cycloclasticus sp.]